ncbi:hypothetical protein SSS_06208 [Sarcoptes scabiei]|uniref:RING-CH-type domain-containing protein n=1 Tax=Sarcoptes scabiei TaxID=52283 RepID=A0A834RCF5_SARSC|nr:hypothetical protein SSS_06208 [Sarcoptes scabiei]UXI18210.1 hypothetical protein NH340_JMT04153 [Sarcoptes scabiei]
MNNDVANQHENLEKFENKLRPTPRSIGNSIRCRICYDAGEEKDNYNQIKSIQRPLISPCQCSGSIKWIHLDCLIKSIEFKNRTFCEICLSKIKGIQISFVRRTFLDFLRLNPDIRNEFLIAVLIIFLLQISLISQHFQRYDEQGFSTFFWLHVLIQISFITLYSIYTYVIYQQWIPRNLRIQINRNDTTDLSRGLLRG